MAAPAFAAPSGSQHRCETAAQVYPSVSESAVD